MNSLFFAYRGLMVSYQGVGQRTTGAGVVLAFGDYRIDIGRRELRRGSEPVVLEPKAFDLLAFLIRNRDRVVSKDDLLAAVWDGRIVSDSAIITRINAVRRALGDDGSAQRLIRTFNRKGLRFIGEVTEPRSERTLLGKTEPLERPCIAVLPFRNLSDDTSQGHLADAMTEEAITALSRIRWLCVIARDAKRVRREPGVRYALGGSVTTAGGRVRIAVRMIETATGGHLWAERFDGSMGDVFGLQDKVASRVAGVVEPVLQATETARLGDRPTNDLSAYEAHLRVYEMFSRAAKQVPQALAVLEQAIARDPYFGPTLAMAARCCMRLCLDGSSEQPASDRRKGVDYARRALRSADGDAGTLANSAMALAFFGEDIGAMKALVDRALVLNPSCARGWHVSSMLQNWAGQPQLALAHAEIAQQLSPRGGFSSPFLIIGISHLLSRRFDEALAALLLAAQELPADFPDVYRLLVASYAHMGRRAEAQEVLQRLRGMTPLILEGFSYLRDPEHRELVLSGLRLAAGGTARRSFGASA